MRLEMEFTQDPQRIEMNFSQNTQELELDFGKLITLLGLPAGGSEGDIIVKNSDDNQDASWTAPANTVEEGNAKPVTSGAVHEALKSKYTKPENGIPTSDLEDDVLVTPNGGALSQFLTITNVALGGVRTFGWGNVYDFAWTEFSVDENNVIYQDSMPVGNISYDGTFAMQIEYRNKLPAIRLTRPSGTVLDLPLVAYELHSSYVFSAVYGETVYSITHVFVSKTQKWNMLYRTLRLTDYANQVNKPSINGVTLDGSKTAEDLSLVMVDPDKGLSTNDYTDADKTKLTEGYPIKLFNATVTEYPSYKAVYGFNDIQIASALANGYFPVLALTYGALIYYLPLVGPKNGRYEFSAVMDNVQHRVFYYEKPLDPNPGWRYFTDTFAEWSDLDGKVDKESGKGLSTNDYTTEDKDKLSGIASGAQVNNVFIAEYGVTTADEIQAVLNAGKVVACLYMGVVYTLTGAGNVGYGTTFYFSAISSSTVTTVSVNGSTWAAPSSINLAKLASPSFSGTPRAPTPDSGDSSTKLATTAFVQNALPAVPTKTSELTNDSGFLTSYTETDPTVPSWAKEATKPSYTPSEVGALPNNTLYAGAAAQGGTANKAASIPFGQVDASSTATAFTATVDGISELRDGVCCYLKNGVVTSAANCTLDINGLGAKPLYSSMAAASRSTTIFNINYTMLFIYNSSRVDGGCWDVFYGYDSNTNTIGYQLRTNGLSLPMSEITYRYRLLFTSADGTKFVPANTSNSTNATSARTVNQTMIDPHGRIVYYGTTASVAAGSRPSAAYLWTQYVVTLGYSFNRTGAALVLDTWKPVYVKCTPQSDGSAIIDPDDPYVQDLPTTEDGKIYIFLGIANAATTIELVQEHPVYCYWDGAIKRWTGIESEIDALKAQLAQLLSAST